MTTSSPAALRNGTEWHAAVFRRDGWRCAAEAHAPGCTSRAEHAHHICYRSHIPKVVYWVPANGIALSNACHTMAHRTHNASLPEDRLRLAVLSVNSAMDVAGCPVELRVRHFERKATA